MELRYQDIETIFLLLFILSAAAFEAYSPARVAVRSEKRDNLIGFFAVVIFVNIARTTLSQSLPLLPPLGEHFQNLPSWSRIGLTVFMVDFCLYWIHRSMHEVPALWRTHVWHHSATNINWLSGFRTSFLHAFLFAIPQIIVPFYIFQFSFTEAAIAFSFAAFVQIFAHSNVNIPSQFLNTWIATPSSHRLHHAERRELHDSNYGIFFLIWDHMFGTYKSHTELVQTEPIGVQAPSGRLKTILGL